ncbi:MAG TPA: FHA domain-containing protein [Thermoanaerobaculia bacterium]|nr:FHA domain-containing protein [Thermoanaerobaculia bacterium]
MIIQCTSCQARYHYDESRFGGAAVKKIKCTKCTAVFEIRNPAIPGPLPVSAIRSAADPSRDEFALDETALTEAKKRKPPAGIPGAPSRVVPSLATPPEAANAVPASAEGTGPIGGSAATTTDRVPVPGAGRHATRPLRLPTDQRLSLACISGPDSGRIFEIEKARVVIGRANADIIVADIQCSRQHAAIEVMDEHVFVVDLNSTNGTYVNDQRVTRSELDNRSEFEIGTTTLMLIRSYSRESPSAG